jgi:hypothetical protein
MIPPIHNTAPPIRWLTTSLLTQHLPAEDVIAMYQGEIEHLRTQRMYTAVMQQVRSQWMQQQGGQVYGVRYGQMGMQQGGLQQRSQMKGLQPGLSVGFGVQQPGHRVPQGVAQPGQYVAVQQAATQPPAAMRSGAVPAVVDPVLPPQQAPSAEEKTLSHDKAD